MPVLYHVVFEVLFLPTCGYALWKGGVPERIAAGVFLVAATASMFVVSGPAVRFARIEIWLTLIDVAVLLSMVGLASTARRVWPIWMTLMEAMQVSMNLAVLLPLEVDRWAYWRGAALWSYPMVLLLALATACHRGRLKRAGADPSWRRY